MKQVELAAEAREQTGSRDARRLRRSGRLPANLYGHGDEPQALHVDGRLFNDAVRHHARLLNLKLSGQEQAAVIQEVQYDPVSLEMLHVDLVRVNVREKIEVAVPIKIHGPAKGEESGGILVEQMDSVTVRCTPLNIPEAIEVDVRDLDIHDSIHVKDLSLPDNVESVDDPEKTILSITEPRFGQADEAAEGEEGAEAVAADEPEVIGKPSEPEDSDDS